MNLRIIAAHKMKIFIAFIVLASLITIGFFLNNSREEVKILFVSAIKNKAELPQNYEWFIVSSMEQYNNWVKKGLKLPKVDFEKNFLIISKYKIKTLYRSKSKNGATGAQDGIAVYDEKNSEKSMYYTYLMDKIWLSQAIG